MVWNKITNPNRIRAGQQIEVYSPELVGLFNNINSVTKKFNKEQDF